ncbi:CHAT domain-containing protein [Lacinutrix cladophorae]
MFKLSFYAQINLDKKEQETDSLFAYYLQSNKLDSLADFAHKLSVKSYNKRDYKKAIYYALKEIEVGENVLDEKKYKKAIYNLALFYYKNEEYYKSINTHKIVIDSFPVTKRTYYSFNEIGRTYNKLGDYFQAINYYKKGLAVPDSLSMKSLIKNYINFSHVYYNIETIESLKSNLDLLRKSDSLYQIHPFKGKHLYSLDNSFANHYSNELTFNFNESKKYYFYCLNESIKNKDTSVIVAIYNNLGKVYNTVKNDSAYYFLQKGLSYNLDESVTPKLYANLAAYYTSNNEYEKASRTIQKALQINLRLSPNDNSYITIPSFEEALKSTDKFLTIILLKEKALSFLNIYKQNNKINNASLALKNLILADIIFNELKSNSIETKSKLFWQKEASELYMLGVKTSNILNDTERAFYFIEKNKALLLLENINENEIKNHVNLPENILEQELQLKKKINKLENKLTTINSKKNSLEKDYYSVKIEYQRFIESLKKKYPKYYDYKKTTSIISLKHVKNKLDSQSIILEYIINNKEGFLLAVTKSESRIFKLDSINNTLIKLDNYLSLISKPLRTQIELNNFNSISNNLYNLLFPFQEEKLINGINKFIIIPDYTLQNLPFETLKNNSGNYLLKDHEVSYAYSMSFLEENKKINRQPENEFLGFAPNSFNYEKLEELPGSKAEIKKIKNILSGDNFTDENASKENFFKKINDYKILHLATHANANDSISPWIAFKNEKLYLNELNTSKNQADLVFLSACNSSLGKINPGEGVFSLARGFFHSGANSVISSLWNVNDKSTQEITTSFYKYLKKGSAKSQALRQAKLDYLNTYTLSESSPYYWSSLILIGDDDAIKLNNNSLYFTFLCAILIMILFFIFKKLKIVGNKS